VSGGQGDQRSFIFRIGVTEKREISSGKGKQAKEVGGIEGIECKANGMIRLVGSGATPKEFEDSFVSVFGSLTGDRHVCKFPDRCEEKSQSRKTGREGR